MKTALETVIGALGLLVAAGLVFVVRNGRLDPSQSPAHVRRYDVKGENREESELHLGPGHGAERDTDSSVVLGVLGMCEVAEAMGQKPMPISPVHYTYAGNGTPPLVPHVSATICSNLRFPSTDVVIAADKERPKKKDEAGQNEQVSAIFQFKSPRSGSTHFSSVLANMMKATGRPVSTFYEPFCRFACAGPDVSVEHQEATLRLLLTHRCDGPVTDLCHPEASCRENAMSPNRYGDPVHIVGGSPKFFNGGVSWRRVLGGLPPRLRIFSQRRTNLVDMAYSLMHHILREGRDGLPPFFRPFFSVSSPSDLPTYGDNFTLEVMAQFANYILMDMEYSTSVAHHAAASVGAPEPFLILYEDITSPSVGDDDSSADFIQSEMMRYIGLTEEEASRVETKGFVSSNQNVFEKYTSQQKIHGSPLCSYPDVNCTELRDGLSSPSGGGYPCLLRQFDVAASGVGEGGGEGFVSWSVPMLANGTVHIAGDCRPLEPLSAARPRRSIVELYTRGGGGGIDVKECITATNEP